MPSLLVDMMWWGALPASLWTSANAVIPAGTPKGSQYAQTPATPAIGVLADYPAPLSSGLVCVSVIQGPASYQQLQPVSPMTGGQLIRVSPVTPGVFGTMCDIDFVTEGMSDNAQYEVFPFTERNPVLGTNAIRLMWTVAATGREAAAGTNLSGRTVRLFVTGS